jgi:hypothetical protein
MGRLTIAVAAVLAAFILGCGPGQNYPPTTPSTPTGPAQGVVNTPYHFSTRSFDHENDQVRYQFYWDDGTRSDWTEFTASGTFDSAAKSWTQPGTYAVRARARDKQGEISDSSEPHTIGILQTLPNRSPRVPQVPNGPDTGWKDSVCTFSTSGTDPDGDDVAFRFDWGDGNTSRWSALLPSGSAVSDTHAWLEAGTFPVRAMARDIKGLISDWSDGHATIIRDSAAARNPNDRAQVPNQ